MFLVQRGSVESTCLLWPGIGPTVYSTCEWKGGDLKLPRIEDEWRAKHWSLNLHISVWKVPARCSPASPPPPKKRDQRKPCTSKLSTAFIASQLKMFLIQSILFKHGVENGGRGVVWAIYFYFFVLVQPGTLVFHCQNNEGHIYYLVLFEIISTMFKVSIKSIQCFQAQNQKKNKHKLHFMLC